MSNSFQKQDDGPVYFWRETEPEYGFLSQWYSAPFEAPSPSAKTLDDKMTFITTEQYMMYHKAVTFQDFDIAEQIMKTTNPKKQKSLGRKVSGFDNATWDKVKEDIVEEGNFWKFTACKTEPETMKQWLLNTGSRQLVEASPFDRIWGIGHSASNAVQNRKDWGENLLGKSLMRVRTRLHDKAKIPE